MNKALLALLALSLSAFFACSAKVVDGDDSGLLSTRSSELQTSSGVKTSSSLRNSSSQTTTSSEEAISSEDTPSSEAKSSTRRSSSTSISSASTTNAELLIVSSEKILSFDKTKQHILTQPWTYVCIGESTPQSEGENQIWLYWLEGSTLYTTYDFASNCAFEDCSTEEATALLVEESLEEWTGGTEILGTWESQTMDGLRISDQFLERLVQKSELTDIERYYPNVIGPGSTAKKIDHSTMEVSYNGYTIQMSLGVTAKEDTLIGFHLITRENDLECRTSLYHYPSGSEPASCPTDSYLSGDNCYESFETDVNTMEICDLDYLNDGECDDYCLNFDDAVDCQGISLFKKAPSKKIRKPLSKLRL